MKRSTSSSRSRFHVKWLAATLVAITLVVGALQSGDGSGIAYLTHAGGLAAAWIFWRTSTIGAGFDRLRQRVSPVPDLPDEAPRAVPRSMPRTRERAREVDDIVAQSQQAVSQRVAPSATVGAASRTPRAADRTGPRPRQDLAAGNRQPHRLTSGGFSKSARASFGRTTDPEKRAPRGMPGGQCRHAVVRGGRTVVSTTAIRTYGFNSGTVHAPRPILSRSEPEFERQA